MARPRRRPTVVARQADPIQVKLTSRLARAKLANATGATTRNPSGIVATSMILLKVTNALRSIASTFPPLARRVGESRMRANCGGAVPAHVSSVVYRPTAGFVTTLFRFEPPFRRDGWPKDFVEREVNESGSVPSLALAVTTRLQPPLEISRAYYHARLDDGIVCWIYLDESSNRGVLFELG